MATRRDFSDEAEALFRRFAERHALSIEKIDHQFTELLMRVPTQPGLSFDLTLGLQNYDELNLGFGNFWSYFFPFEKVAAKVEVCLDALIEGRCRLATRSQLSNVFVRNLELQTENGWEKIYGEHRFPVKLPFVPVQTVYLRNGDVADK